MSRLPRATELLLPVGLIVCLLVVLTPLPPAVLDLLLIGNIALSVIVLLTTIYVAAPLEFNVFPTVLVGHDAGPAGAERLHDSFDSHGGGLDGTLGRRWSDSEFWPVRGGRPGCGRHGALLALSRSSSLS